MGKKSGKYDRDGISQLDNNKPALYRIEDRAGNLIYVGTAKRGRVQDRIAEHLGEIPGAKVKIEQFGSIKDAQEKEANVIKRSQPKYNKEGT